MSLVLKKVTTSKELSKFIKFPFSLYKNNAYWVPPLIGEETETLSKSTNPAFEFCDVCLWLAYRNNKIVGRIAGIINHKHNDQCNSKYARFGWIDFVDDTEVSALLLKGVENWAFEKGAEAIHGPLGFSDMDHEGTLIEGFDQLGTMATIYNYPYYQQHFENAGYVKDADWVEYEIKVPKTIPERAQKISALVMEKRKLRVLDAKKPKDFLPYANDIFNMINDTFQDLYGYVQLNEKQIALYVKQYFPQIVADYVKVLLDEEDKLAGFTIAMPSLSRALQKAKGRLFPFGFIHLLLALKFPKQIDLYLGAIRNDLQGKGADALLITELYKSCIKNGIISAESNVELEDNLKVRGHWKHFDSRQHKRRRCFIKQLDRQ